ncbi:MAG: gephyrin-like molybdotransferase Glp [Polyangiaceae bacterium]
MAGPLLPFAEALERLLGAARVTDPRQTIPGDAGDDLPPGRSEPPPDSRSVVAERVDLDDALGRVLAEDLRAPAPMPAFDYSSMDGYAVAVADLAGAPPWTLPVAGESAAGGVPSTLVRGGACRIFTGAEIPPGADAVVMQENVERRGDSICSARPPAPGANIRRQGEDLRAGAVALSRGTRLGPGALALCAGLDRARIAVARRPRVTVLCSGDELRRPGEPPRPGSIPESNGFFVAAAARLAGATARVGPFVRDDLSSATEAVREALRDADVLVTIGGVSVGDHDVIKPALEAAGVTLDFWRVAIKPGKPIAVGRRLEGPNQTTHVLGLPGNPASASLTFLLFGMPLLRTLAGDDAPLAPRTRMPVDGRLRRRAGREEFARGRLVHGETGTRCRLLPNQSSGSVVSFGEADALVIVPAERETVDDGDALEVMRIADF